MATIILMPAIIIKNPSSVLNVPSTVLPTDFFCKIRPSMAINAINIEAWPSKSVYNKLDKAIHDRSPSDCALSGMRPIFRSISSLSVRRLRTTTRFISSSLASAVNMSANVFCVKIMSDLNAPASDTVVCSICAGISSFFNTAFAVISMAKLEPRPQPHTQRIFKHVGSPQIILSCLASL
ncbi:Uncharacterised protein [Raoultella ornithinolytica]|nr:Uncharacterised protein [Raoultella ornithinolytica]